MTPTVLVSYLDRMFVSSEGARAEGAELEIPYRKENAQALVLHQWALWPLRPSPIPHFLFPSIFRFPVAWQHSNQGLCRRLPWALLPESPTGLCSAMLRASGLTVPTLVK